MPIKRNQVIAYGLPVLTLHFLYGPIAILQGIYAKYFGLSLTTIASVLLVARLFDAISDPAIGYITDRYYSRRGSRKPFIVLGGTLFVFSSWFLFVPPDNVSVIYFQGWFLAFYFAYTLFEIPHMAWGGDLVHSSAEKNSVYGLRSLFLFLGSLLFFAMPLLPVFESSEFTPQTLKWSVIVAGLTMLPMLYICARAVPDNVDGSGCPPKIDEKESVRRVLISIVANKPLLVLTAAHACTGFAAGLWMTILFIFVDSYLLMGEGFALLYVISFALGIIALRFWYYLANRYGKQLSLSVGLSLVVIGMLGTGFLHPTQTKPQVLLVCMTLVFSGYGAFNCLVPSILSDIVDYGRWKFGVDRGGFYFSLYAFVNKTVGALGGALALALVGLYGFDPTQNQHADSAVFSLRLVTSWLPALFTFLSLFFIAKLSINARRHAIVMRRFIDVKDT